MPSCVGQPVGDRAQVEERSRGLVIDSPVPSPSAPLEDFGQGEGEVLPVPGSVFNDEEAKTSEPVFDDSMGDVGHLVLLRLVRVHRVSVL